MSQKKNNRQFYEELLPLLAEKELIHVGILYDGNRAVSVEITYTFMDRAFFSLGTYNTHYSHLSPGTVSTALFIRYFFSKGMSYGDFLAGFANYVNPLAEKVEMSKEIVVFKINYIFIYYATVILWNKIGSKIRKIGTKLMKRMW